MKCLKCGSETHMLKDGVRFCNDLMCDWNSLNPTHQQRLDKVLARFKQTGISTYIYKNNGFEIAYYDVTKQFTMYRQVYELDTIELMIRDMETHNE